MLPIAMATAPCRIPFQASGFKLANGTLIASANVSTYVYDNQTGGNLVYSETWDTGLQNGYVSVTMGNDTDGNPLELDWGLTYWLAVSINGTPITMVDSYGVSDSRQAFISTQGEIVQLTQTNASLVTQTSRINVLNATILTFNNLTLAQIAANIGNWTLDKISYASTSWVTDYIGAMSNLTLSQISANLGNWTLDKSSYASITYVGAMNNLSLTQIASNIGNWTLDKINYATIAYVNALNNLSYSQISANIGNWTLDKPNYASTAYVGAMNNLSYSQISANIGNYSKDQSVLYLNVTGLNTTKVPYTGATGAVNLGTYNITAQNYSVTGSPGYISGNSTCFKMNFNSTMWFGIGSAC
jgi:predicted transcriptional regulator YdeE